MCHARKNATHSEKCGTLGKVRHLWINVAHLEKYGTLGKVQHTLNNPSVAHFSMRRAFFLALTLFSKCATFFQVCRNY